MDCHPDTPKSSQASQSTKLPRKRPDDPIAFDVQIMREATLQDVGDVADKITRGPNGNDPGGVDLTFTSLQITNMLLAMSLINKLENSPCHLGQGINPSVPLSTRVARRSIWSWILTRPSTESLYLSIGKRAKLIADGLGVEGHEVVGGGQDGESTHGDPASDYPGEARQLTRRLWVISPGSRWY